jgi:hypothetical protein
LPQSYFIIVTIALRRGATITEEASMAVDSLQISAVSARSDPAGACLIGT